MYYMHICVYVYIVTYIIIINITIIIVMNVFNEDTCTFIKLEYQMRKTISRF